MMDEMMEEIFCDLMELPLSERMGALAEMSALSEEQKERIRLMLEEAVQADDYFTGTFVGVKMVPFSTKVESAGEMCGTYKLVHKLGEGGFGVVWLAEQETPLKRTVAVKVIKAGMDSSEVLARFDAEKRALARMDHPNIAKVLDAGVTDLGRPYFVMEMVAGKSITRYCQENELNIQERLRLFCNVCSAVSHAHQKGIIHRDIKPSNVIVTEIESKPVVKVIDFGIAKAIEGQLTDHTLRTRAEQWIGTPVYMSPEQAGLGGTDVDTRSDIYGLGVLLYELITGEAPFDPSTLMKAGYEEMRRIIREVEPPRPSIRITTSSRNKDETNHETLTDKKQTVNMASTELDWIVMKAMEKAKERRYESAAAFSSDVGRYLADEPIEARPPSTLYLLSKFARRHRLGIYVGSAFLFLIIAAVILSVWLAFRALEAEKIAQERLVAALQDRNAKELALEEAEAISNLLAEVFQRPQPGIDGRSVTVVQALDAAVEKLDEQLIAQPQRKAKLRAVLAETYERLGIFGRSFDIRKEDFEFQRDASGMDHIRTRQALRKVVEAAEAKGDSQAALDYAQLELETHEKSGADPQQIEATLRSSVRGWFGLGKRSQAIEKQRELVDHCAGAFGKQSQRYVVSNWELQQYESRSGAENSNSSDKISQLETKFIRLTQAQGPADPETLEARSQLTSALMSEDHIIEALLHLQGLQSIMMEQYGPQDEKTLNVQRRLVWIHLELNHEVEAVRTQQAIVNALRERDGGMDQKVIREENILKRRFFYSPLREERRAYLEDLLERRTKLFGENHVSNVMLRLDLGLLSLEEGKEGIPNAIEIIREHYGDQSRTTAGAIGTLARKYLKAGRTKEAIPFYEACGPNMRDDTWINFELATFQLWMNNPDGYRETRRFMLEYWTSKAGQRGSSAEMCERAMWLCSLADYDGESEKEAIRKILSYVKKMRQNILIDSTERHTPTLQKQINGIILFRLGDHEAALEVFREVVRIMTSDSSEQTKFNYQLSLPMVYFHMAMSEYRMGNKQEAKRLFEQGESLLTRQPPSEDNPVIKKYFSGGHALVFWISHREAKNMLSGD